MPRKEQLEYLKTLLTVVLLLLLFPLILHHVWHDPKGAGKAALGKAI